MQYHRLLNFSFSSISFVSPLLFSMSFCLFIGSITLHYASWTYIIVVTALKYRTKHWIICVCLFFISLALFLFSMWVCVCVWYCYCFSLSSTYSFASLFRSLNCCIQSVDRNKTNANSKTSLTATHTILGRRKTKNQQKTSQ